jgi:hypothetical protein
MTNSHPQAYRCCERPAKAQELFDLLRAVIRENDEEILLWVDFLKKKYAFALTRTATSD